MDIRQHRSWMYDRFLPNKKDFTQEFVVGVNHFIEYVKTTAQYQVEAVTRCPCRKCENRKWDEIQNVHGHLLKNGFVSNYWYWTEHGENIQEDYTFPTGMTNTSSDPISELQPNNYVNMIFDHMRGQNLNFDERTTCVGSSNAEELPNSDSQHFYNMLNATSRKICACSPEKYTELSVGVNMMSIKSDYNESQAEFNEWAQLLKGTHGKDNVVPSSYYETKKLLRGLGLTSVKIDCCKNGCMIYYKDDSELSECKFCDHPRFKPRRGANSKNKPIPYKRMHYLPLTPRLQRLYASSKSAEHMRWHAENTRDTGVLIHPSDGIAWKNFDQTHPDFASETRNVRLGLCADGFNPFSKWGANYSIWPVIVTPYNLPPELCMTNPYMFLTCIIPGPQNPKNRIDVYLQPLIDELKLLWLDGVLTYDISRKQNFQMRAALMWTINDFPAYGMLSGWMTAGRLACPICMDGTKSFRLKHGGKTSWFDCHRQFLPADHSFRRNKRAFQKGRADLSQPPIRRTGDEIFDQVRSIPKITDMPLNHPKFPGYGDQHNWVKQSIFWELPYWKDNSVRHNLDVMHIEKNVFDNVLNTVMDVKGKTKDNEKSRMDLPMVCNRRELHLRPLPNGKIMKPKSCFTLSDGEKKDLCDWIISLKMPDGYASNLGGCVDHNGKSLHGLKSHDCHIFMQRLLPFAFLSALPAVVYKPLTELSQFFRDLCATELKVEDLLKLEINIPLILCKLERIFPPSFFDVMEHLPVHLPFEALMCGPVQYRWMYPFERFLHDLKRMVKNRARVEGSICEAYLTQEQSYFSSYYFDNNIPSKSTRKRRNETYLSNVENSYTLSVFSPSGRPAGKCTTRWFSEMEMKAASLHVLSQCEEVLPFIELYKSSLRHQYPQLDETEVQQSFDEHFVWWFQKYVHDPTNSFDNTHLKDLAWGPFSQVQTWPKYFVNGYMFHTENYGMHKSTYNSGICLKGEGNVEFYGKLNEVVQLTYPGEGEKKVVLFNCEWFDSVSNRGVRINKEYGHIEIKINERYPKYDPFILSQHASQAYYIPYPGNRRDKINWRFVVKTRPRSRVDSTHIKEKAFQEDNSIVNPLTNVDDQEFANLLDSNQLYEEVDLDEMGEDESDEIENEYESSEESEFSDDDSDTGEDDDEEEEHNEDTE